MPPARGKRKKGGRRRRKRSSVIPAVLVLLVFAVTIVVAVVFLADRIRHPGKPQASKKAESDKIYYEEPAPGHLAVITPGHLKRKPVLKEQKSRKLPLVAIVIDDMGYNVEVGRSLIKSGMNLSFAFLPEGPHTAELLALAERHGRDRLLHFPMEPANSKVNPGPGAIFLDTPYRDLKDTFMDNLALVPGAMGINNHMGSRYTQNVAAMREFLGLMAGRDLFFLDSFTSTNSVGYTLAREMGIRAVRRDVFLDNIRDPEAIGAQLAVLVRIAGRHGWAVGIGHPHHATLRAISSRKKWLSRRVRLVGVSRLAH